MRSNNRSLWYSVLPAGAKIKICAFLLIAVLVLSGCSSDPDSVLNQQLGPATPTAESATPLPTATTPPTDTPMPPPTETPQATATPLPTPTPEPLTAGELFELVSPSIARVSTGMRYGSGSLLENGYVLTNAHVVWPEPSVDLRFPDGSEFSDVPVAGLDMLADLALLGPIDTALPPLTFTDPGDLRVGDPLLLIGYPGAGSQTAQPTLTETLVSQKRENPLLGLSLLQVSASVAGGQSGGVALNEDGQAVGMTGHNVTEAMFGLVTSGANINARLAEMLAGASASGAQARGPVPDDAATEHKFILEDEVEQRVFVVDVEAGDTLELSVSSENDAMLFLDNLTQSDSHFADNLLAGEENLVVDIQESGRHFVVVEQATPSMGQFVLTSNVPLTPYRDPDDGRTVLPDSAYQGAVDFPGDLDEYFLALNDGDITNISVNSLLIDPALLIGPAGEGWESGVGDDDSGQGIFGTDAELTYQADRTGNNVLMVIDVLGTGGAGGYVLTLQEPYAGAPTPQSPLPTPAPIVSEFGDMALYESAVFPYSMQYPAAFVDGLGTEACANTTACFVNSPSLVTEALAIVETEIDPTQSEGVLEQSADNIISLMGNMLSLAVVERETTTTAQGEPAIVFTLASPQGDYFMKYFLTLWNNRAAIFAFYAYEDPATEPMIDYIFSTYEHE